MQRDDRPTIAIVVGFFDWFSGYQETVLARGLRAHADVHVVTSNWVNPIFSAAHLRGLGMSNRYPVGSQTELGVTLHRIRTMGRPVRHVVWSTKTLALVKSISPQAVLLMMVGQGFSAAAAAYPSGATRIVSVYGDNDAMVTQSGIRRTLLKAAFRTIKQPIYQYCNRHSDAVAGYTPNTLEILKRISPKANFELLPLAYDESVFQFDAKQRSKIRAQYGLVDSDVVVLTSGKFGREKRLEMLVDAVASLRVQGVPVRLVMIGGGDSAYEHELSMRIRQLGLDGLAQMLPFMPQPEVAAWFCAADVGVWPVKPAISIQQAMGTGLPVAIPRTTVVSHLLRSGSGQWIEEPGDVGKIAGAIGRAIQMDGQDAGARQQRAQLNSWLSGSSISRQAASLLGIDPPS